MYKGHYGPSQLRRQVKETEPASRATAAEAAATAHHDRAPIAEVLIGLLRESLKQVHRLQYGRRLHPCLSEPAVEQVLNLPATIELSNRPVRHQSKVGVVAPDDQRVRLKREQISAEAVRPGIRSRQDLSNQHD